MRSSYEFGEETVLDVKKWYSKKVKEIGVKVYFENNSAVSATADITQKGIGKMIYQNHSTTGRMSFEQRLIVTAILIAYMEFVQGWDNERNL